MTGLEMFEGMTRIIAELGGPAHPCRNGKNKSCLRLAHELRPGEDGQAAFWYGADAPQKVVLGFCAPCLAYYYAQVTRNLVNDVRQQEETPF